MKYDDYIEEYTFKDDKLTRIYTRRPPPKPDPSLDPGTNERMILGFTVDALILYVLFIGFLIVILIAVVCGVE